ncbi:argininosuccinate synthase [Candidatus Gracilibacteria bacterium]|nr:argininosuccinate synthase [Candidatus Gracilibacteria bacterium]MCF7855965.1 argininosuccinate synthase [Candidatus Gracilibacteria bacterium]MCF7896342.1 argininosuccinate synthase [Candidatus Gracilibacteria bacterium]
MQTDSKKIVLAYSGGLDTTVIAHFLIQCGFEVIGFLADLGQGVENLDEIREKAKKTGLMKFIAQDLQKEFLIDFVLPTQWAAAKYENYYLLGTSVARPLIAKAQVEIAKKEKAEFLSHGSTGKGNDQVRFELTYHALAPKLQTWIPWREPSFYKILGGRKEMLNYAQKFDLPVKATKSKPWSSDENLLHISYEAGILENPNRTPPEEMFELTVSPQKAPDKITKIELEFRQGIPIKLNGKKIDALAIFKKLNVLGGANGIGRVDLVENRFIGMKSRGVYETPGGTILFDALRAVESLTIPKDELHARDRISAEYAELVYNGFWYSRRRKVLAAQVEKLRKKITGKVTLGLYKGNVSILGREAAKTLYDEKIVTFETDGIYEPAKATRFIRENFRKL